MYGIFTYIYHINCPDVSKYTSPIDGMGFCRVVILKNRRFTFFTKKKHPEISQDVEGVRAIRNHIPFHSLIIDSP